MRKKTSPRTLGLCFLTLFLPHVLDSVFFRTLKKTNFSLSLPDIFQGQGSGYSPRGSSGTLYRVSPVKIPSKWGLK